MTRRTNEAKIAALLVTLGGPGHARWARDRARLTYSRGHGPRPATAGRAGETAMAHPPSVERHLIRILAGIAGVAGNDEGRRWFEWQQDDLTIIVDAPDDVDDSIFEQLVESVEVTP